MSCNIISPQFQTEECNGCYQHAKCVITDEDNNYLGIKEGDSLEAIILVMENKLKEAFERIIQLEATVSTL